MSVKAPLMWNFPRDPIILFITVFIYINDFTFTRLGSTYLASPMVAMSALAIIP